MVKHGAHDPYSLESQLQKYKIDPAHWAWRNADYRSYQSNDSGPRQRVYGDRQVTSPWGRGASDGCVSHLWISGALVNMLTVIPGVTVFHRLRAPGTPNRPLNTKFPLEHAVLHGSTIFLIDPNGVSWPGLSLGWTQKRNGRFGIGSKALFSRNHEGLADGARRFSTLPGVKQVIPILAMDVTPPQGVQAHPTPLITPEARWSPEGVGLFRVLEMMDFIGSSVTAGLPSWRDNPDLREAMIGLRERTPLTLW
ncbi:hypothetical protein [Paenarthrobacter ilicis]|uniref:Uncharacterized protein n=1 Tax=Paenarthrobacter ilicis TaxID=43665 RepID=A0ABX0TM48_9MICC|nr:hypothetical protein [Paenarthrobacter ilicis]MBM7794372.1 hypothetical protein [Paenarthrobacter ilicis]NIJ02196.1 hypothetical protein [Paenarthrobacter ilicis]